MRPSNATISAETPDGIPFQWLLDRYKSRGARDASMEQLEILVSWADSEDFLAEAVGYTTWDGSAKTFTRVVPLEHPFRTGFFVDDYDLTDFGAYEHRTDFNDPGNNDRPVQDWCIYTLTFVRHKYWVRTDEELAELGNIEQFRYCLYAEMPRPRELLTSGWSFEYDTSAKGDGSGPWQVVPEERTSIPDWQRDIHVTLLQVPIDAVPHAAITESLNRVNRDPMQLTYGGKEWQAGYLLFKGLAKPIEMYFGADDQPYMDLAYLFTVTQGGWNTYLTRDAAGKPIFKPTSVRRKDGVSPDPAAGRPITPPYSSADFKKLFQPGEAP